MPKMPIPANQVVNPQKMELTFPFGGTTKHELQIVDSTGAVIVPETIIDRGPTGGSGGIGGEVTINLIGLPHEGPYLAGKYKLTQKGLALKKNDEDSDTATMEFEMSSELAALANSRLAMKAFVGMEAKLQLLEADHGEKLKHFPDLKKSIEKLEALLAGGKADLTEVKNLNAQIKIALASIGTLKNEFAAALHELQEALKKVTAAKVAPAKKTAKKPSATSGGGSNTDDGHWPWITEMVLGGLVIIAVLILGIILAVQHGLLAETRILAPNGGVVQSAPVPQPPQQWRPPVVTVTNIINVFPPAPSAKTSTVSENIVQLPAPGPGEIQTEWNGYVNPRGVNVFYKPEENMEMFAYFNQNEMHGEQIPSGNPYAQGFARHVGMRIELNRPSVGPRPLRIVVRRTR